MVTDDTAMRISSRNSQSPDARCRSRLRRKALPPLTPNAGRHLARRGRPRGEGEDEADEAVHQPRNGHHAHEQDAQRLWQAQIVVEIHR